MSSLAGNFQKPSPSYWIQQYREREPAWVFGVSQTSSRVLDQGQSYIKKIYLNQDEGRAEQRCRHNRKPTYAEEVHLKALFPVENGSK